MTYGWRLPFKSRARDNGPTFSTQVIVQKGDSNNSIVSASDNDSLSDIMKDSIMMDRDDDTEDNNCSAADDHRSAITHESNMSSLTGGQRSSHATNTTVIYYSPRQKGESLMTKRGQPTETTAASSVNSSNSKMSLGRSEASTGRDYFDESTIGMTFSQETTSTTKSSITDRSHEGGGNSSAKSAVKSLSKRNQNGSSSSSHMKWKKLRKHAPRLARMGQNVLVKNSNHVRLPYGLSKYEVLVDVKLDKRVQSSSYVGKKVQKALQEELRTSYCCLKDDNPCFVLKVEIVLVADGTLSQSMLDGDSVVGLTELGCIWSLRKSAATSARKPKAESFDDKDQKGPKDHSYHFFEGGLVAEYEDVGYGFTDILFGNNKGEQCLLETLVPRLANAIVSKIGGSTSGAGSDMVIDQVEV